MSISETRHGHGDQRLQKQTNTSEQKGRTLLNIKCRRHCEEGTKALGGNESVWDVGCVYKRPGPGWSARVHPAVTGSEVSGSQVFLKKIREAELKWSTSGLRTEDCEGFLVFETAKRRDTES